MDVAGGRARLGGGATARMALAILLLGAALRLAASVPAFYHHPDEVWQYLEPAYYLGSGRWVETWEWRIGMRSWLMPALLAGPFWAAHAVTASPAISAWAVRAVLALLSLTIPLAGMAIGARISRAHALLAGLVLATAFETVFLSAHPLSDSLSADLLLPAAALLLLPRAERSPGRLIVAGALLGLTFSLRFQLAPMLGALALLTLRLDLRAWGWLVLGAVLGLAADAAVDLWQHAVPFRWVIENFRLNLVENRSANYGTEPAWWYVTYQFRLWGWLSPVMLLLIALGARRAPVLLAVALVNIGFHMLVPHKEFRFIFPSEVLLLLVAGLGTGELFVWAQRRGIRPLPALLVLGVAWAGVSAAAVLSPVGRDRFHGAQQFALWQELNGVPGLCGYSSVGTLAYPAAASLIDRPVAVYMFIEADADRAWQANRGAFNATVSSRSHGTTLLGPEYRLRRCFPTRSEIAAGKGADPGLCLFVRPGGCTPGDPHYLENASRARVGN